MIYTELTKRAMGIAFDAHEGQLDKGGVPYIFHPIHLAEQMAHEVSACVALLHDVVEDSCITLGTLAKYGFSEAVIETIRLLAHDVNIPYMDYIRKIKASGNQTAITVKLADLRHNCDVSRLNVVDDATLQRLQRYEAAIRILEDNDDASNANSTEVSCG